MEYDGEHFLHIHLKVHRLKMSCAGLPRFRLLLPPVPPKVGATGPDLFPLVHVEAELGGEQVQLYR